MKDLNLALIDYNPETLEQARKASRRWGHEVNLSIAEPELVEPNIQAIRLGEVAVDMIVCNRTDINDRQRRELIRTTRKPVIRYEVAEIDFYMFKLPPLRGIDETFYELYKLRVLS